MASPRPKPSKQKKLEGTYRKDRAVKNEMKVSEVGGIPVPPAILDQIGKQVWITLCTELYNNNLLHSTDLGFIQSFCYHSQLIEKARKEIDEHGMFTTLTNKGGFSYEVENPAYKILCKSEDILLKIGDRFGFNPSARTRISAPVKKEEGDDLTKLLNS